MKYAARNNTHLASNIERCVQKLRRWTHDAGTPAVLIRNGVRNYLTVP